VRSAAWAAAAGAALGGFAAHAAPIVASFSLTRGRPPLALYGHGRRDHVALTFDDGPDPASTPAFLRALDELGWRATFFLLGTMVASAPSLAAEVVSAGHEVAVHGHEHRQHTWRTPRAVHDDLRRAFDVVSETTGARPQWFRPPFGVLTSSGMRAARGLGLRTVLWSAWGRDWLASATPTSVVAEIVRDLRPGGTVLLHDSDCTSEPGSWRAALGALPRLADRLAAEGLRAGPLREHGV
jgi:peptidoglycan/xylan/chitin deacetylase (PgdA/CDA1 family)